MKFKVFIILTIAFNNISAQGYKETKFKNSYFSLECKCIKVKDVYDERNHSHDYTYEFAMKKGFYLIGVRKTKMTKNNQEVFFNSVKNDKTTNYVDSYFLRNKSIITYYRLGSYYVKEIHFFSDYYQYVINIMADSETMRNSLNENLIRTFNSF